MLSQITTTTMPFLPEPGHVELDRIVVGAIAAAFASAETGAPLCGLKPWQDQAIAYPRSAAAVSIRPTATANRTGRPPSPPHPWTS